MLFRSQQGEDYSESISGDNCKKAMTPIVYTEGAETVFHERKPGSQLSNLNPNTVLGLNLKLTAEGAHKVA